MLKEIERKFNWSSIKKSRLAHALLLTLFLSFFPFGNGYAEEQNQGSLSMESGALNNVDRLYEKAVNEGAVRLIVHINVPGIDRLTAASTEHKSEAPGQRVDTEAAAGADAALNSEINKVADSVADGLRGTSFVVHHTFDTIPFMVIEVSPDALDLLVSFPEVLGIEEDEMIMLDPLPEGDDFELPTLNNTVNIIGATNAWAKGYTGSGWYVAILDTGIRKTHDMFAGKSISEACFSCLSHCPNNSTEMIGTGAAAHYPSSYSGYDHGTHVSGIAAGNNGSLYGVARDANIIAIQVFSKTSATEVGSYSSDQLKGLQHVYSLRTTYSIGAANESIGGGKYSSYCDSDSRKAAIDNLKAVGIATAIATGNNGYCGYTNTPGCISTAFSIGASSDSDVEASFNNWDSTIQDFFAPGVAVYSATGTSNSSYASWNGTSMATPHVAGAVTLMRQAKSSAGVDAYHSALTSTGKSITSKCTSTDPGSKPRIQVDKAIDALVGTPPGAATLVSPTGTITDTTPTYTWNAVSGATWYYLYVREGSTGSVHSQWYTSSEVTSGSTCSVTPTTTLNSGGHTWWIQTYNSYGHGPWSSGMGFTVGGGVPGAATLVSPTGTITDTTPTYTWNAVSGATWYYLYVREGSTGSVHSQWYTSSEVTSGSTCSVTPTTTLNSGGHTWWILTYNSYGHGPWSSGMGFTVGGGVPGAATLVSPTGTITDTTPTYTWNAVSGATWYYLYVREGSTGSVHSQWYTSSEVTSGSTCSVTPTTTLNSGGHTWWIQTYNSYGHGPWSSGMGFTVGGGVPGAATLVSPTGTITDTTPTYTWNAVSGATWYYLYVREGSTGSVHSQWYTSSEVTSGSTCSVTPTTTLNSGGHTWWIQTYNSYGHGPWSSGMGFTVSSGTCYEENFNDGVANGWVPDEASSWSVTSNWYKAYKANPGSSSELMTSYYSGQTFTNGTLDIDVWHEDVQEMAQYVYLRSTKDFDLGASKTGSAMGFGLDIKNSAGPCFGVWKYINGSYTMIKYWTYSSYLNATATNHLKVIANGNTYTLYINGHQVYTFSDSSFSSGYISVGGWTGGSYKETYWYDNVKYCPDAVSASVEDGISEEQLMYNIEADSRSVLDINGDGLEDSLGEAAADSEGMMEGPPGFEEMMMEGPPDADMLQEKGPFSMDQGEGV